MLELELPPGRPSGDCHWESDCPFCQREYKFSWNYEKEAGHCRSTGCGKKIWGKLNYLRAYKDADFVEVLREQTNTPGKAVPIWGMVGAWEADKSRDWLVRKGFSEITTRLIGIKYHVEDNELWLPVSSISDDLPKRWLRRPLWGKDSKWLHEKGCPAPYYGWNVDAFKNSGRNVLLCEGLSDLAVTELFPYGIALLGSKPKSDWFFWLKRNCGKVYVWLDPDEAGESGNKLCEDYAKYYGIDCEIIRSKLPPKAYDPKSSTRVAEFIERVRTKIQFGT